MVGFTDFLVSFWPSEQEIVDSACEDGYLAGLTEFYNSLDKLRNALVDQGIGHGVHTYVHRHQGKMRIGAFPPEVGELLFHSFGILGYGVVLYKLLRLWVELKKGRMIRVKLDDIEVEATQLTEKQFIDLLATIEEHAKKVDNASKMPGGYRKFKRTYSSLEGALANRLESEGFILRDLGKLSGREARDEEKLRRHHLLLASRNRFRDRVSRRRKKNRSSPI